VRKIDFSAVSDATARQLLQTHARDIRINVGRYSWLSAADQDELRSAAALAVLEAHLTYKEIGKGSERGWVIQVIRWRLADTFAEMRRPAEVLTASPERTNGADPEQQFWRATAVRAIGHLSPRHRVIVDGRMRGETFEEIAASLGLSTAITHRESTRAFEILRGVLEIEDPE
jgi:DNA-directed RNA polymerase specialized sigma24 family protein